MGLIRRVQAWRRYREMSRRLAELDRLDAEATAPAPARRKRRFGWFSKGELLVLVAFVVIVGLIVVLARQFPELGPELPTSGYQEKQAKVTTRGPHAFLLTTPDGRPVTYDPCQPIHYVVNPNGMPEEGAQMIREAVDIIREATGLTFIDDGLTDEVPRGDRPTRQPERYGDRWAPVLFAWVSPNELVTSGTEDTDIRDVEGNGGSTSVSPGGPGAERFVTGEVLLSRDGIARLLAGENGYARARAVVIHELAHVVGLDHVDDPNELMAPVNHGVTELGPGDREGLAKAGAGLCWR